MSNFERERQKIERLKQDVEQRKIAEEEEKRKRETEIALRKTIHEANLTTVLKNAPNLLRKANEELFSGKGSVSEWTEITTPIHSHSGYTSFPRDGGGMDWNYTHLVRQLETRLKISGLGDIVVFIPLQVGHTEKDAVTKPSILFGLFTKLGIENRVVYKEPIDRDDQDCWVLYTTESSGLACSYGTGKSGLLTTSSQEDVSTVLVSSIGEAIVGLHREYLLKP